MEPRHERLALMQWTVFARFNSYIDGLADGQVQADDGATIAQEGFQFPRLAGAGDEIGASDGRDAISFAGAVHYRAHHGMLAVTIAQPSIIFVRGGALLTVAKHGTSTDRMVFARLGPFVRPSEGAAVIGAAAQLDSDGSELFNFIYPAGTALDPVFLVAPGSALDDSKDRGRA